MNFEALKNDVLVWAEKRGILKRENHKNQALKMVSEVGELCDAIIKNDETEIVDGIGDLLVTVIILTEQLDLNPTKCLNHAYEQIKNRTGENRNGIFIKD